MTAEERLQLLKGEALLIRDSGELPEIAYHSALHFLTADEDGPQLTLSPDERKFLQEAALVRCRQIVLRDLEPANRGCRIYRGPLRSIYTWQRYLNFCKRINRRQDDAFRECVAEALPAFLAQGLVDIQSGGGKSSVNCSRQALLDFAAQLELTEESLPSGWQELYS